MSYIQADVVIFYLSVVTITCYTLLFVYHFVKKQSDKSLMILAGCLCLYSVFIYSFESYITSLDKQGAEFANVIVYYYPTWIIHSAITSTAIVLLHVFSKIKFHYVNRYVLYGLMAITLLNLAMYIDIIVMGNREPYWLWTVFSYGENMINVFVFSSIMVGRKWSEVFRWLQLAHSR
jgi:hypothetical protein